MQSVSSRIWTRIAVFISYSDNDYTTGTSKSRKLGVAGLFWCAKHNWFYVTQYNLSIYMQLNLYPNQVWLMKRVTKLSPLRFSENKTGQ